MALPKILQPTYDLTLPISKVKMTYRPFLVKEEKLLLLAAAGKDQKEITSAVKQIVNNCLLTQQAGFGVDSMPAVELDYLFLNMRAKSIGDKVEQEFTCNNEVEGKRCGHVFIVPLSVSDVVVTAAPKVNTIKLTATDGVKMKLPTFRTYDTDSPDVSYDMLIDCLDSVYDEKQSYPFREQTREETIDWIEGLTKAQFQLLQDWYDTLPALEMKKKFKCGKCGFEHEMEVGDPISFF
jgi:hypothetical protein